MRLLGSSYTELVAVRKAYRILGGSPKGGGGVWKTLKKCRYIWLPDLEISLTEIVMERMP